MTQALENKEEIDAAILPLLQSKLNKYNSGLKVVQVKTQSVDLLPEVDKARQKVEEVNQCKKGKEEEAQKYNNTIIPNANADAAKVLTEAEGYAAEIIAEGDAYYTAYTAQTNLEKQTILAKATEESAKIRAEAEQTALVIYQKSLQKDLDFYRFIQRMNAYKELENETIFMDKNNDFLSFIGGY